MEFKDVFKRILSDNHQTQVEAAKIIGLCSQSELGRLLQGDLKLSRLYQLLSPYGYYVQISNGSTTYRIEATEKGKKEVGNPAFKKK